MEMTISFFARWSLAMIYFLAGLAAITLARLPVTWATEELVVWLKILHCIILAIVAGGVVVLVIKRAINRVWWESLLNAALLFGVWYALALVNLPFFIVLLAAIIFSFIFFWLRIFFVHNIFYVAGAVGLALNFALHLPLEVALAGLAVFAVYDMVCGRSAETHLRLTRLLSPYGLTSGFILPNRLKDWCSKVNRIGVHSITLGLSEVVLPLILVVKSASWSNWAAALVLSGLTLGAVVYGWRKNFSERSALAYVSAGVMVAFLILYLGAKFFDRAWEIQIFPLH